MFLLSINGAASLISILSQFHHSIICNCWIVLSLNLLLIIVAGFPATTVYGGISFVTTALAPITAPFPMFTPERIIASVPTYTSFPIVISSSGLDGSSGVKLGNSYER